MAGCVTPSFAARAVSRHGPDRSSVASVAAVVSDRPGGLSQRIRATRRSSPAATSAAWGWPVVAGPVAAGPVVGRPVLVVCITRLYYLLMLMLGNRLCRHYQRKRLGEAEGS